MYKAAASNFPVKVRAGWCKARVFQSLYNYGGPTGMGVLNHTPGNVSVAESWQLIVRHHSYFDYVNGWGMKLDLHLLCQDGRELESRRYDARQHGPGSMKKALEAMYQDVPKCTHCTLPECQAIPHAARCIGEQDAAHSESTGK